MARFYRSQLFWLGVMILAIILLVLVRDILFPFILGIFLTYLTLPTVKLLESRQVPRPIAIISVYLGLAILIWAGIVYLLPTFLADLNSILNNLGEQTERLDGLAKSLSVRFERLQLPEPLQNGINEGAAAARDFLTTLITRVIDLIIQSVSKSFFLILAPILAYYMTRDIEVVKVAVVKSFPQSWQPEVLAIGREINRVLSGFVRGQLIISLFVGLSVTFGLVFLKIPYALVIGIVAGVANIIPYFGPVVGAFPAVIAASTISSSTVMYVIILFAVINQFEAVILAPKILEDKVGLHPLVVIFAVMSGGRLFGLIGSLIAVPIAAIIKVIFLYCRAKFAPV